MKAPPPFAKALDRSSAFGFRVSGFGVLFGVSGLRALGFEVWDLWFSGLGIRAWGCSVHGLTFP